MPFPSCLLSSSSTSYTSSPLLSYFLAPVLSCRFICIKCLPCLSSLHFIQPQLSTQTPFLVFSFQPAGVAGPSLPRSARVGLYQLATGFMSALHLHHCLLQHLERSQDVWKGSWRGACMADGGCQLEQMDGLIDGDIWTEEKKQELSCPLFTLIIFIIECGKVD